jgi:hypothetical protein
MIRLTDDFEKALTNQSAAVRRRRIARGFLLILVLAAVALVTERFRGQSALKRWKTQMTAKGEKFDVTGLWPSPNASNSTFSNQLANAAEIDRGKLAEFAGSLSPLLANERGEFRRGSQEDKPQLAYQKNSTNNLT